MLKWVQSSIIGLLFGLSCSYIIVTINIYLEPDGIISGQELAFQCFLGATLGISIGLVSQVLKLNRPMPVLMTVHYIATNGLVFLFGSWGGWFELNLGSV